MLEEGLSEDALSAVATRLGGVYLAPYSGLTAAVERVWQEPSRWRLSAKEAVGWQAFKTALFGWDGSAAGLAALFAFGADSDDSESHLELESRVEAPVPASGTMSPGMSSSGVPGVSRRVAGTGHLEVPVHVAGVTPLSLGTLNDSHDDLVLQCLQQQSLPAMGGSTVSSVAVEVCQRAVVVHPDHTAVWRALARLWTMAGYV